MQVLNCKVWVEHNPQTGSIHPYEVWFKAEGKDKTIVASCKTNDSAVKSAKACAKRNTYKGRLCTFA